MNEITGSALNHDFGYAFNYASWSAGTVVSLMNVPWNNSYKDIVSFDTIEERNTYMDSRAANVSGLIIEDTIQLKFGQPIRLDIPFNKALNFNYIRVRNSLKPIPGDFVKDYFYFINGVADINTDNTEFTLQLDIWMTFGFDIQFGMSYIERGHIGIANQNAFNNYGRDYLSIPEGFDLGSEYVTMHKVTDKIMDAGGDAIDSVGMEIMVISAVNFESDALDIDGKPRIVAATGDNIQGLPSGANYYFYSSVADFVAAITDKSHLPWVTQGIISITAIPRVERYGYSLESIPDENGGYQFKLTNGSSDINGKGKYTNMFTDWRNHPYILERIPLRYRHLKKFLTAPYLILELTTRVGTPIIIRPENWASADARIAEKISLSAPNQRIVIYPMQYNARPGVGIDSATSGSSTEYYDDYGDYLDKATIIANFPSFAVVNNAGLAALASQFNSISFANSSNEWAQTKALTANTTAYDQAAQSMLTNVESNRINRQADQSSTGISNNMAYMNAAMSGVGGIGSGAMGAGGAMAGAGAAVMGMGNAAMQVAGSQAQLAVRNLAGAQQALNAQNNALYMRDTNKTLADFAARGDYANQQLGINAKVQDTLFTPPSIAGQVGGQSFNLANDAVEVSLRWKFANPAAIVQVGEYWLRFGYAVNRPAMITTLKVMTKFTYWKLMETYITSGNLPEIFKTAIRGIFEKGVTVWSNPDDIGNIDWADNEPLEGITL